MRSHIQGGRICEICDPICPGSRHKNREIGSKCAQYYKNRNRILANSENSENTCTKKGEFGSHISHICHIFHIFGHIFGHIFWPILVTYYPWGRPRRHSLRYVKHDSRSSRTWLSEPLSRKELIHPLLPQPAPGSRT